MKFILDEKDGNFIKRINEDIADKTNNVPLIVNQFNKNYYIQFEVTDIAKACNFITCLLYYDETRKQAEEILGIKMTALNYSGLGDLSEVKEDLRKLLDKVEKL